MGPRSMWTQREVIDAHRVGVEVGVDNVVGLGIGFGVRFGANVGVEIGFGFGLNSFFWPGSRCASDERK